MAKTPDLRELATGAAKAFDNAKELFVEASLLRSRGMLSRALFLHQISLEEIGKIDILCTWATCLLDGSEIDVARVSSSLTKHKSKNYTNAYKLAADEEEREAKAKGDWDEALQSFKGRQAKFHLDSNTNKNAALYVNLENGVFSAPKEQITQAMVDEIAGRNADFLEAVSPGVRMLVRWCTEPDTAREMLLWLTDRFEALRSRPREDLDQAFTAVMEEALTRAKSSHYGSMVAGRRPSPPDPTS